MWSQKLTNLRSAVADGVKEFRSGALTEVKAGITETKAVVKEEASKVAEEVKAKGLQIAKDKRDGSSAKGRNAKKKRQAKGPSAGAGATVKDGEQTELGAPQGGSIPLPSMSAIRGMREEAQGSASDKLMDSDAGFSDVALTESDSSWALPKPLTDAHVAAEATEASTSASREGPHQGNNSSEEGREEEDEDEGEDELDWGLLDSSAAASGKAEELLPPQETAELQAEEKAPSAPQGKSKGRKEKKASPSPSPSSMTPPLSGAEQKARNAGARLQEAEAGYERERERWEEERRGLEKQVEGLRAAAASGAKEREVLESSVNQLANQLETRLSKISGNVEAKDAEMMQLREENELMNTAFEEMRVLLKQSVDERARLNEEMLGMERQLAKARKGAVDTQALLEASRRDHLEASMALAEATTDDGGAGGPGMSEEEREALEGRLREARGEAEEARGRLEAAVEERERAEEAAAAARAARLEAERLRREAQAEMRSAVSAAEAERVQRAEAQGQSEQLKTEGERRARVFNNAVKVAVQKIQRELEEENAALQQRVEAAEAAAARAAEKAAEAEAATEGAFREAALRSADAEAAGNLAVVAQEGADRSRAKEREARQAAEDALARCNHSERAKEQLQTELAAAEARTKAAEADGALLAAELSEAREKAASRTMALETEVSLLRSRAEAAAVSTARAAEADAAAEDSRRGAESAVAALEQELAGVRRELEEARAAKQALGARGGFALPTGQEVLQQLGLDKLREERLLAPSKGDLEAGAAAGKGRPRNAPKPRGGSRGGSLLESTSQQQQHRPGMISSRTWFLILYAAVLHLAVMMSYTKRHDDIRDLCAHYASSVRHQDHHPGLELP